MIVPDSSASSAPSGHRCGVCDKPQAQVEKLVVVDAMGICGECILLLCDAVIEGPKRGEERYDQFGLLQVMAATDGYVMVRRPTERPFVVDRKEWESLASNEAAVHYTGDLSGVGSFLLPVHRLDRVVRQRGLSAIPARR